MRIAPISLLLISLVVIGCQGDAQPTQTDGGPDVRVCSSRLDCPGQLGCVDGVCGFCVRDRDCLVSEWCHPLDNLCHGTGGNECRLNEDCDLGLFCVQGYCKQVSEVSPCTNDSDCLETERCDPWNLVCIEDQGCDRDGDCAATEVCDLALGRCVNACTIETQEAVCGFGLVCDADGRCVECLSDDQCGVGLTCNLDTMRCEGENSCVTNRDCLPGQTCNPQTMQCTVPPTACLSNNDCPDGTLCDSSLGQCISAECHDDAMEPNDDPAEAAALLAGRSDGFTLCPGDLDWYAIALSRGDRLQVIVNTDFLASHRFHTVLFDPSATEVLQEDSLLIDAVATKDAPYLLRIQTTDPQASYGLVVTISRGIPCDDDEFEPNDSAYAAWVLSPATFPKLVICPHDEDWFVIERPLDQRLEVKIEYPASEGDLDLDLIAGDAQTLIMRSATAGNSEYVFASDQPGTRFYLRVYADLQTANQYEMQVQFLPR